MTDDHLTLTIKNATDRTGLSRSQIYRWLADGTLDGKKLGRRTFVCADSLRQAMSDLPDYRYQPKEHQ
jgi:excisionase family DNA binding protein